jgi:carboxymethylenebutenolidase
MGHSLKLTAADGQQITAYVAEPIGKPRGGIVVVQEIFGVNSHIREVADGYAKDGYLAIAPGTFERVQPDVELGYGDADRQAGFALKLKVDALPAPGVLQDLQAAIDYAAQHGGGKVGIAGYCWGGLLTWRAACLLRGLSAAVPYYGGGMTTEEESARQPQVPVLAHFAEQDQWITLDSIAAFRQAHPEVQVYTYPAHHGFNCNHRDAWNEAAATTARERTLAFFAKYVG